MRRIGRSVAGALTLAALVVGQASIGTTASRHAQGYSFRTIDPPGSVSTFLFGINARGDIVGQSTDAAGATQAFLLSRGRLRVIRVPGAAATRARGINSWREIVGVYSGGHGFLLSRGVVTTLDYPGAVGTRPRGIHDAGDIAGDFSSPDGSVHGFLLSRGRFTQLDFPGACATLPDAINDARDIVGDYGVGTCDGTEEHHGFRLRDSTYSTLDDPDGAYQYVTVPYGINARGRVVGTYDDAAGLTHGFLLRRGTFTDIDAPDAFGVTRCFGINVRGWIVGDYFDAAGVRHGFLTDFALAVNGPCGARQS
ncbi:MAG TPA: hypothetical protein VMR54_07110 [Thermoanaerobaculia bacterium]|nr:hypothetical protein [Thermoanaerobaculia bacterium]